MSGRRKNAGLGYGYMFHGAFAKKADAVAKERKTKGAWVKGVLTNTGQRYIVMSPRTNPIKRKKKAPKPAANPSELLVMGANPAKRTIDLPAGSEITIRVNPEPRENINFGFLPAHPTRADLAASRREFRQGVRTKTREMRAEYKRLRASARAAFPQKGKLNELFHEVYGSNPAGAVCGMRIGGELCTRQPGHRGPHLPQGATLRTRNRLPHHWQPRASNPTAADLRAEFTGKPSDWYAVESEPHMPKGDYAKLGDLLVLYVKPLTGGQVQEIRFEQNHPEVLADESARQIWFAGGNQTIERRELSVFGARPRGAGLFELGEARRIDYKQRKEHVPQPEIDEWRHEFGEETGVRPLVLYDSQNKRLLLEGGEYQIRREGIVN